MSRHGPPPENAIDVVADLAEPDVAAVHRIAAAAKAADGIAPLDEQALLQVTAEPIADVSHLLARGETELAGYAQLDQRDPETPRLGCVVAPAARRRGWGRALVERGRALVAPRRLELWAHGDLPAAAALAERLGFERVRELWQLRRGLGADLPPAPVLPDSIELRTFRSGVDDVAWLELNARAFADHPEQGRTTRADLAARMAQPWFDPEGFFVAERSGTMVGFHWTKVHDDTDPPVGEVYVVGVDPDAQGLGLGRALTLIGLRYLRDRGLGSVLLYVDAANAPAVAVYTRLGFTQAATDTMYRS